MTILEKLVAGAPAVPEYQCELAGIQGNLGRLLQRMGRHAEGEALLRSAIVHGEKLVADSPLVPQYQIQAGREPGQHGSHSLLDRQTL